MVDRSPSIWRRRRSRLADRSAAAPSETACAGAQGARPCSTRSTPSAVAAFLIYAQDGQANALVPFAVAGTTTTTIQAEFNGVKGNTVTIPVVSAAPGVFTQAYGPGQTWMVNSGGTFNSNNNPAARNTYVAFWATGQGLVNIPWKELCLLPCVCFVNAQTWVPGLTSGPAWNRKALSCTALGRTRSRMLAIGAQCRSAVSLQRSWGTSDWARSLRIRLMLSKRNCCSIRETLSRSNSA
ncbi:MAG: hypothetical protein ACLPX8_21855 [Bryobacteraceae bacterium]